MKQVACSYAEAEQFYSACFDNMKIANAPPAIAPGSEVERKCMKGIEVHLSGCIGVTLFSVAGFERVGQL